jgi:hypothetical protein
MAYLLEKWHYIRSAYIRRGLDWHSLENSGMCYKTRRWVFLGFDHLLSIITDIFNMLNNTRKNKNGQKSVMIIENFQTNPVY